MQDSKAPVKVSSELVRGGWWPGCCFLGRAPPPGSHPSWAQVGWGSIREGFSRHGKEEPFLASDTSFPQPFPASRPLPVAVKTLAWRRMAWPRSRGRNNLSAFGLDPGLSVWLMPYSKEASRRVYSPPQRPPSGRAPHPAVRLWTSDLPPVRQGLLQKEESHRRGGCRPLGYSSTKQ